MPSCKTCHHKAMAPITKLANKRKADAVALLGGKCSKCGTNKISSLKILSNNKLKFSYSEVLVNSNEYYLLCKLCCGYNILSNKVCNTCKINLPISRFHKKCDSDDGHAPKCVNCSKHYTKIRVKITSSQYLTKKKNLKQQILNHYGSRCAICMVIF